MEGGLLTQVSKVRGGREGGRGGEREREREREREFVRGGYVTKKQEGWRWGENGEREITSDMIHENFHWDTFQEFLCLSHFLLSRHCSSSRDRRCRRDGDQGRGRR